MFWQLELVCYENVQFCRCTTVYCVYSYSGRVEDLIHSPPTYWPLTGETLLCIRIIPLYKTCCSIVRFRCTHPFLKEIWRAIDKPQSCDELQFKLESLGDKEKFCLVWNMFYRNAANEQTIINTQEVTTPQKSTVSPPIPPPPRVCHKPYR